MTKRNRDLGQPQTNSTARGGQMTRPPLAAAARWKMAIATFVGACIDRAAIAIPAGAQLATSLLVLLRDQHHHGDGDDLGHPAWDEPTPAALPQWQSQTHGGPGPGQATKPGLPGYHTATRHGSRPRRDRGRSHGLARPVTYPLGASALSGRSRCLLSPVRGAAERVSSGRAGGPWPGRRRHRAGWAGDRFGPFARVFFEVVPMGLLAELSGTSASRSRPAGKRSLLPSVSACRRRALSVFSAGRGREVTVLSCARSME